MMGFILAPWEIHGDAHEIMRFLYNLYFFRSSWPSFKNSYQEIK